jgi:ABC-type sugar transport system permease subunit
MAESQSLPRGATMSARRSVFVRRLRRNAFPYMVLIPILIWFAVFAVYPFLYSLHASLYRYIVSKPFSSPFAGLSNYTDIFTPGTRSFTAFTNTLIYVVLKVGLVVPISLGLALLINKIRHGQRVYIYFIFLPALCAAAAIGVLFLWLYNPTYGLIDNVLANYNLPTFDFVTSDSQSLVSVIVVDVWQSLGFGTIIFLAGLLHIPETIHEAARMDGGHGWQLFRYVTLPLLAPTTLFLLVITMINAFQAFDFIFVMTQGGPGYSSYTLSYQIYFQAFENSELGPASAAGGVMFVIVCLAVIVQFRLLRPNWEY